MVQESRPQSGEAPADGVDCGAYRGDDWTSIFNVFNRAGGMIHTLTGALPAAQTDPNIGVFYQVANRLAVTSPGASQISIATGCSQVDGRLHINDTAITATAITNPAGNPRIDRVVVRQNYGIADYTSVNAPALIVPFNTARIAIISGAEAVGPVAPVLVQDTTSATYWDIPLAQYQIAVGGAITNLVDEREWVDAETKYAWAGFHSAHNDTDGVDVVQDSTRGFPTDGANKDSTAYASWRVPQDYISGMSCKAVVIPDGNGDIRISNNARHGVCDEDYETNRSRFAEATVVGLVDNFRECIAETTLDGVWAGAAVVAGDMVQFSAVRRATNVADTLGDVYYLGELIEYLGWGRR